MGPSEALAANGGAVVNGSTPVEIASVTTSTAGQYVFWGAVQATGAGAPALLDCGITVDGGLAGSGLQTLPAGDFGSISVVAWQPSVPAGVTVVLQCGIVGVTGAADVIDGRVLAMRVGSLTVPP